MEGSVERFLSAPSVLQTRSDLTRFLLPSLWQHTQQGHTVKLSVKSEMPTHTHTHTHTHRSPTSDLNVNTHDTPFFLFCSVLFLLVLFLFYFRFVYFRFSFHLVSSSFFSIFVFFLTFLYFLSICMCFSRFIWCNYRSIKSVGVFDQMCVCVCVLHLELISQYKHWIELFSFSLSHLVTLCFLSFVFVVFDQLQMCFSPPVIVLKGILCFKFEAECPCSTSVTRGWSSQRIISTRPSVCGNWTAALKAQSEACVAVKAQILCKERISAVSIVFLWWNFLSSWMSMWRFPT